jgi:hypothetical protein
MHKVHYEICIPFLCRIEVTLKCHYPKQFQSKCNNAKILKRVDLAIPITFDFLLSQPRKTQPNIEQTQHINFTSKISSQHHLEEKNLNWHLHIREKSTRHFGGYITYAQTKTVGGGKYTIIYSKISIKLIYKTLHPQSLSHYRNQNHDKDQYHHNLVNITHRVSNRHPFHMQQLMVQTINSM